MELNTKKYMDLCTCSKALWMKSYHPEAAAISQYSVADAAEVSNLVKLLFKESTVVKSGSDMTFGEMVKNTKEQMKHSSVIHNAAFCHKDANGNYHSCIVDILRHDGEGYSLYTVSSSTGNDTPSKNKYADMISIGRELAFQKWIVENCGTAIEHTYLIRINAEYVLNGELNVQDFFHITNMDEYTSVELLDVEDYIKEGEMLMEQHDQNHEPDHDINPNCKDCEFWQHCSKNLPAYSVFNLYRMNFKSAVKYYEEGMVDFSQMQNATKLNSKQQTQIDCTLNNKDYINKEGIKTFLSKLKYPIYFLDFETEQFAIPKYQHTKPYQQVPFQYSLHWKTSEESELKHSEFLGDGISDPRRSLSEKLCQDIPLDVCTTAYNKSFECGRIREMAKEFPDLADHLNNIADNIVDLLEPFQSGFYYSPSMNGSFSIKKVLPSLFPQDPELNYSNLPGNVHNGVDAMTIYPLLPNMTEEEKAATRTALLQYCCLDTYAMVKIWEKLLSVAQ